MRSRKRAAARTLVRFLAVTVLSGIALFGSIAPAGAKGPESATISGPGIDQPIELIDGTNPDLVARLMEQTVLWFGGGDPLPGQPVGDLGPGYALTWVNAGPPEKSVEERTIRQVIYLEAESGPLIHTPAQDGLEGWGPGVTGWFAAPNGLRDTLVALGAPLSAGASPGKADLPGTVANMPPPEVKPVATPWYLGLLGLALVATLAGGFTVYAMRGRTGSLLFWR
jgi:hypothetical protein